MIKHTLFELHIGKEIIGWRGGNLLYRQSRIFANKEPFKKYTAIKRLYIVNTAGMWDAYEDFLIIRKMPHLPYNGLRND